MKPIATTTRLSNINPPPQPPPPQRLPFAVQLDLSQAAAATLVFISTIFCFFILCAYCRHCTGGGGGGGARSASDSHRPLMLVHQGDHSYSSEPKPAASLPPELPLVLYAAGADGKEEEEEPARDCVVCLGEFEEDKELKVIPGCGHLFHPQCIDAWLVSHGSCPVCRCSQLFGVAVGEGEGQGEGRGEVCVDAMMGESGGEDDEEGCAGGIREEFGMGRREREGMGGRGGEEEEVEGRRYCCSSSSSRRRREDGGTATQI